ncbi:3'-kinase, partial [Citrobacter portucalensis]|nr:3'-kinase [Citrobacter portucalensis]
GALDVDPRRLLDQAYAYGCLSAAWKPKEEEEQRVLAIAAAIRQGHRTSYLISSDFSYPLGTLQSFRIISLAKALA